MTHTADRMLAKMRTALDLLAESEARRASLLAQGRERYQGMHPATAEARTRTFDVVQQAERDWALAHQRVQTYGIAATALLAEEARDRASDVDDCKPLAIGAGPGRRAS